MVIGSFHLVSASNKMSSLIVWFVQLILNICLKNHNSAVSNLFSIIADNVHASYAYINVGIT